MSDLWIDIFIVLSLCFFMIGTVFFASWLSDLCTIKFNLLFYLLATIFLFPAVSDKGYNKGYEQGVAEGYKQGQIDYYNNVILYELIECDNGQLLWRKKGEE